MKKVMLILGMVLCARVGFAYEIKGNPDMRPSIGFNFDRTDQSGDYESHILKFTDAGTLVQNNFRGDIRLPITSFLTFSVGGGYSTTTLGLSIITPDERWRMKGYNLSAGFRIFIP